MKPGQNKSSEMSLDDALEYAVKAQQNGQFDAAKEIYRRLRWHRSIRIFRTISATS
jgi:hypothetical protein